jgi:hypothetical protein
MFPLPMFFIILYMLYLFNIIAKLKYQNNILQENTIQCNQNNTIIENNNKNSIYNKELLFEYNSEYLHIPQFHPQLILI